MWTYHKEEEVMKCWIILDLGYFKAVMVSSLCGIWRLLDIDLDVSGWIPTLDSLKFDPEWIYRALAAF